MYNWIALLYSRSEHNMVNQLYSSVKPGEKNRLLLDTVSYQVVIWGANDCGNAE